MRNAAGITASGISSVFCIVIWPSLTLQVASIVPYGFRFSWAGEFVEFKAFGGFDNDRITAQVGLELNRRLPRFGCEYVFAARRQKAGTKNEKTALHDLAEAIGGETDVYIQWEFLIVKLKVCEKNRSSWGKGKCFRQRLSLSMKGRATNMVYPNPSEKRSPP